MTACNSARLARFAEGAMFGAVYSGMTLYFFTLMLTCVVTDRLYSE